MHKRVTKPLSLESLHIPNQVASEHQHILISKFNLRPAAAAVAGTTTRPALTTPRHFLVPPPNQYEVSRFPYSASGRAQVQYHCQSAVICHCETTRDTKCTRSRMDWDSFKIVP